MRLFAALELSPAAIQIIHEWREPLIKKHPSIRWIREDQLHVTLRFLGDREAHEVIREMKDLSLEELFPIEYTFNRTGTFGKPPAVLWLSGKFSSSLLSITHRLDSIPDEDNRTGGRRPFIPHVTIARARRGKQCYAFDFDRQITGSFNSLSLISSRLSADGPAYSTLFTISKFH
ncbi:MAG: RNA 2',3'-cyclic phosphodiesterase [Candidatus Fermentibacteria bacterium]|nr:RNA 2',3'-cyclic phosphodiesterase [Candidatus Fermentibacteria bacterium]